MTNLDALEAIQTLHGDLSAVLDGQLANLDRLYSLLELSVENFRQLWKKPLKNEKSRQALLSGTITIEDKQYSINEEFKQDVIRVAEELDLDEVQAAQLYFRAQKEAEELDRSAFLACVIMFHKYRQSTFDSWRLIQELSVNPETNDDILVTLRDVNRLVLRSNTGKPPAESLFWKECLAQLKAIEDWMRKIGDRQQSAAVISQAPSAEMQELLGYQKSSLTSQHESVAGIAAFFVKSGQLVSDDFRYLLPIIRIFDRHDSVLLHYVPIVLACISHFGPLNDTRSLAESKSLHEEITHGKDGGVWALRDLHAAVIVWWLSEYSGRFTEQSGSSTFDDTNVDDESAARSTLFLDALKDGALQFMLSVGQKFMEQDLYDSTRRGALAVILQETTTPFDDMKSLSDWFTTLMRRQFQNVVETLITNMPDTLRKLRDSEDDHRRLLHSRFQRQGGQHDLHMERFLIIIGCSFANDPEAAHDFWSDSEGNLFGFLQWAAKRQTTPRVAVFCEMLCSLAEDELSANNAHKFLLDEGTSSGRVRRSTSLSWSHILAELQVYANNAGDRTQGTMTTKYSSELPVLEDIIEPESPLMLQCYLLLVAHLCQRSSEARKWLLTHPSFRIHEIVMQLCSNVVESRIRSSCYDTLSALLVEKTSETNEGLWNFLDEWIWNNSQNMLSIKTKQTPLMLIFTPKNIAQGVSGDAEEFCAFIRLLNSLMRPSLDSQRSTYDLTFPENLGLAYRMPGIDDYIDFFFTCLSSITAAHVTDTMQSLALIHRCLEFIILCLSSFDERLLLIANIGSMDQGSSSRPPSLESYIRLHPFSRVMDWLFNEKILLQLFRATHKDIDLVNEVDSRSPLTASIISAIEVINLILSLQATYVDIVRPFKRKQTEKHKRAEISSSIVTFEDALLSNLQLVVDLCLYCGTSHEELVDVSFRLLKRLSISKKLISKPTALNGQRLEYNNLIGAIEKNGDTDRICKSLSAQMKLGFQTIEIGPTSPSMTIKRSLLEFLNGCLSAFPNRPNLAHLLLGFQCEVGSLRVADDGLFSSSRSLFHSLVHMVLDCYQLRVEYPVPWVDELRQSALIILQFLWQSRLSSAFTLSELRNVDFVLHLATQQTPFRYYAPQIPDFPDDDALLSETTASAVRLLLDRSVYFDYASRELKASIANDLPTQKDLLQLVLLGVLSLPDGTNVRHLALFDLFDFMNIDADTSDFERSTSFSPTELENCRKTVSGSISIYDLDLARKVLYMQLVHPQKFSASPIPRDNDRVSQQIETIILKLQQYNEGQSLLRLFNITLQSWAQLARLLVESFSGQPEVGVSISFYTLRTILPALEQAAGRNATVELELILLAVSVLQLNASFKPTGKVNDSTIPVDDMLVKLLQIAIKIAYSPISNTELRIACYEICYRCLQHLNKISEEEHTKLKHVMRLVADAGDDFIESLCDDATTSQDTLRISSLLLLEVLVSFDQLLGSQYTTKCLTRINFISILLDVIKQIPNEVSMATSTDVSLLLQSYEASLSLLLRFSQTRSGAAHIVSCGLFQAIGESLLFSTDPDIGFEMQNSDAVNRFLGLMLSTIRVVNATVVSRGPQNDQTLGQARQFLQDNSSSISIILKKSLGLESPSQPDVKLVDELVDHLSLLYFLTDSLHPKTNGSVRSQSPPALS